MTSSSICSSLGLQSSSFTRITNPPNYPTISSSFSFKNNSIFNFNTTTTTTSRGAAAAAATISSSSSSSSSFCMLRFRGQSSISPLLHHHRLTAISPLPATASHHDSTPSEFEEQTPDANPRAKEFEEAWNQTSAYFKEQALKTRSVSQEAYEEYSKKAIVVLKETSEQLKIQAEKARQDLSVIAIEASKEGKEYLSTVAENSPQPVKDIVETFASSTTDLTEISQVRDFYLGIPYGVLLSFGGFLSFMITGSISAIRFGVILGGALLALSISSLRSWKEGESSSTALKGQTAIASLLFLKDMRVLYVASSFANFLTALISGSMVAFYIYRISLDNKDTKGPNLEPGKGN